MSYILDALRKAERERRQPHAPTLDAVHPVPATPQRRLWPWVVVGALAVNAIVIAAVTSTKVDVVPLAEQSTPAQTPPSKNAGPQPAPTEPPAPVVSRTVAGAPPADPTPARAMAERSTAPSQPIPAPRAPEPTPARAASDRPGSLTATVSRTPEPAPAPRAGATERPAASASSAATAPRVETPAARATTEIPATAAATPSAAAPRAPEPQAPRASVPPETKGAPAPIVAVPRPNAVGGPDLSSPAPPGAPAPPRVATRPPASPPGTAATGTAPTPDTRLALNRPPDPAPRPGPVTRSGMVSFRELPPTLRDGMPKLKLEVLAYSERAQERLVFINGQKYVEGSMVDGKVLVEEITQDGAIMSHQGQRFLLRE